MLLLHLVLVPESEHVKAIVVERELLELLLVMLLKMLVVVVMLRRWPVAVVINPHRVPRPPRQRPAFDDTAIRLTVCVWWRGRGSEAQIVFPSAAAISSQD